MEAKHYRERAVKVARERGIARGSDFDGAGVPRIYPKRMAKEGALVRVGRGLYRLPNADLAAAASLAEGSRIQPNGVICLLSALQYHELTTQTPHTVWMLLGPEDWAPVNPAIQIKVVRASGSALHAGIEIHEIDRGAVPVTSPAKTVADCFKYRNKTGVDVAVEALRDLMRRSPKRPVEESGAMRNSIVSSP